MNVEQFHVNVGRHGDPANGDVLEVGSTVDDLNGPCELSVTTARCVAAVDRKRGERQRGRSFRDKGPASAEVSDNLGPGPENPVLYRHLVPRLDGRILAGTKINGDLLEAMEVIVDVVELNIIQRGEGQSDRELRMSHRLA